MCEIKLDQQFVVNIGKSLEPYFSLVENRLLSTSQNQFECSIKGLCRNNSVLNTLIVIIESWIMSDNV